MFHLFNIFRENDGKKNCAQVLEEVNKMFGTKYLNDGHDCNVVSMNSLNIHSIDDDCTSHDKNVSYKHVNFYGMHRVCSYIPKREDRFCKRHKYLETKWLQERLDVCAKNLNFLGRTCGLCNESGHLAIRCKLFQYLIVSKNCDDFITLSIIKSLVFFWGMKK